jgi:hypothetical protein
MRLMNRGFIPIFIEMMWSKEMLEYHNFLQTSSISSVLTLQRSITSSSAGVLKSFDKVENSWSNESHSKIFSFSALRICKSVD